jgi:hypothetical protein
MMSTTSLYTTEGIGGALRFGRGRGTLGGAVIKSIVAQAAASEIQM